ncbi:MAG TPA: B12-binding domain-containing radical SAM protein [Elusimicrobia bacterium]|nr:B12-binding domain-containing radical SAM protein [Elusimicrobiota bacterium]
MKILLILPAVEKNRVAPDGEVPDRAVLRFSVLGLTTLAALTPPEHDVVLVDENVETLDLEAPADLVGISFMTGLAPRAYELAAEFRRRGVPTVAGGFHPTLNPQEALEHFDAVVVGEAEGLWPKALQDAQAGRLQGLYRSSCRPDLAQTPVPRRGLLERNAEHYVTTHAVQTGRGCPHACRFCSIAAFFEGTHRSRPVESVLAELEGVPERFMFVDDNIISDPDYAKRLFRAMAPLGKRWISQCSIKIADDPELLDLAYRAGCRGLFIGIETTSQANLAAMDKGFNDPAGYRERIARIHEAGIGIQAGIIVGLDSDDVSVFERTFRFLQEARIDALQLAILTPQPGTPLHEDFKKAGRILDFDWAKYDYRHAVIEPARMTSEELQEGADWLYAQYYRLDRILLRVLRQLFTLGPVVAFFSWKLNRTYRYDNIREGVVGRNPAPARRRLAERAAKSLDSLLKRMAPTANLSAVGAMREENSSASAH